MAELDHLVYGGWDLDHGLAHLLDTTGVACAGGGTHDGWGTRNKLAGLGTSYLELLAADPAQPEPQNPRPFRLDSIREESDFRLLTIAIRPSPGQTAEDVRSAMREDGLDPGALGEGRRTTPDGEVLRWQLSPPSAMHLGGAVPFLIDWGTTPHPSASAVTGLTLKRVTIAHPDHERLSRLYAALGLSESVSVIAGSDCSLSFTVDSPNGVVTL